MGCVASVGRAIIPGRKRGGPAATSASVQAAAGTREARSMNAPRSLFGNIEQVLADAGEVAALLCQRGWAERNAGNISADVTELADVADGEFDHLPLTPLESACPEMACRVMLISRSGARMRDVAKNPSVSMAAIGISADGRAYRPFQGASGGMTRPPTSELCVHLRVHQSLRARSAVQSAIVHTHPTELIALTQAQEFCEEEKLNHILWGMHPEVKVFIPEGVGFVPYLRPASEGLAEATAAALDRHRIVVWEKHGAIATGRSLAEAFDLIDTPNKSAQIYLLCRSAALQPAGLTAAQLAELKEVERFFRSFGDSA